MKLIILVACALVAVAVAAPAEKEVQVVKFVNEPEADGGYVFGFETDDGNSRGEKGQLKSVQDEENKPAVVLVKSGRYTYIDSDGNIQTVTYEADENGYRAVGPSIPKAERR